MNRIILTKAEQESLVGFIAVHRQSCGDWIIVLESENSSGIGSTVNVICDKCQENADITDYESW